MGLGMQGVPMPPQEILAFLWVREEKGGFKLTFYVSKVCMYISGQMNQANTRFLLMYLIYVGFEKLHK